MPKPSMLERWLSEMESAFGQRKLLHVQTMSNGSVITISKYSDMDSFRSERDGVAQIGQIRSHVRAARREEP